MSSSALATAKSQKEALLARLRRMSTEHQNGIRDTIGAAVTVGAAFGLGYYEARYPESNLFNLAPSLAAGGLLLGLAAFDVAGKEASGYLSDAGKGALAAYAAVKGASVGRDAKSNAK